LLYTGRHTDSQANICKHGHTLLCHALNKSNIKRENSFESIYYTISLKAVIRTITIMHIPQNTFGVGVGAALEAGHGWLQPMSRNIAAVEFHDSFAPEYHVVVWYVGVYACVCVCVSVCVRMGGQREEGREEKERPESERERERERKQWRERGNM